MSFPSLHAVGTIAAGIVWGWLLVTAGGRCRSAWRTWLALAGGTLALGGAFHLLQLWAGWLPLSEGMAGGAGAHALWRGVLRWRT